MGCPCKDDQVLLLRGTSPGKLVLIWKKKEEQFIEGDHTYSRSILVIQMPLTHTVEI